MILKSQEKEKAIKLRKQGFSYSEILKKITVSKSTLSLWLRSVGMAKQQKQRITKKRIIGALKGAKARKDQRIQITKEIKDKARKEIANIDDKNLWLIGTALNWAEGGKEKENGSLHEKTRRSIHATLRVFLSEDVDDRNRNPGQV